MKKSRRLSYVLLIIALNLCNKFALAQIAVTTTGVTLETTPFSSDYLRNIVLENNSSQVQKVSIKLFYKASTGLADIIQLHDDEFYPGIETLFDIMVKNGISDKYLIPGNYSLKLEVYLGSEFNSPLFIRDLFLNVRLEPIQLITPLENNVTFGDLQFCYQTINYYGSIDARISIWEEMATSGSFLQSIELPPLYKFLASENCIVYPVDLPPLNPEKSYLWQVESYMNGKVVGISLPQKFKLTAIQEQKKPDDFRLITTSLNTGNYLFGNSVRFTFYNKYNEGELKYLIVDLNKSRNLKNLPEVELKGGLNLIDLDLLGIGGLVYGHVYKMIIVDANQDKYSIQFTFNRIAK